MTIRIEDLETCANALSGTLVVLENMMGINFGTIEQWSVVLGVGANKDEAILFRMKEGVGDLEFAFRCTNVQILKNPYGGTKHDCVVFTDDVLQFSPLTIVPLGPDKVHVWMKALKTP